MYIDDKMNLMYWVFVCVIFASAADSISKQGDKNVNVALETVLEFGNKESDVKLLDKVQNFIAKVKTVVDQSNALRRDFSGRTIVHFTDFVRNTIQALNKLDDADLEQFFVTVDDEARKYHYRGCKFHELTENAALRRFISNKLSGVKDTPASAIRSSLKKISDKIQERKYNKNEREFVDFINSLYGRDSIDKFQKFLTNIEDFRAKTRKNVDLTKIVKEGVKTVIFDHYSQLNSNVRKALREKVDEYFAYFIGLSGQAILDQYLRVSTSSDTAKETSPKYKTSKELERSKQMYFEMDFKYNPNTNRYSVESRNKDKPTKFQSKVIKTSNIDKLNLIKVYHKTKAIKDTKPLKQMYIEQDVHFNNDNASKKLSHIKLHIAEHKSKYNTKSIGLLRSYKDKIAFNKFKHSSKNKGNFKSKKVITMTTEARTLRQVYVENYSDIRHATHPPKTAGDRDIEEKHTTRAAKNLSKLKLQRWDYERNKIPRLYKPFVISQGETGADRNTLIEEEVRQDEPQRVVMIERFQYNTPTKKTEVNLKDPKLNLKMLAFEFEIPETYSKKADRQMRAYDETPPQKNKNTTQERAATAKNITRVFQPVAVKNKYRKLFTTNPVFSDEGLSIEDFRITTAKGPYRRANNINKTLQNNLSLTSGSTGFDENILKRIMQLQNDLNVIKSQINNDTKVIQSLNSRLREKIKRAQILKSRPLNKENKASKKQNKNTTHIKVKTFDARRDALKELTDKKILHNAKSDIKNVKSFKVTDINNNLKLNQHISNNSKEENATVILNTEKLNITEGDTIVAVESTTETLTEVNQDLDSSRYVHPEDDENNIKPSKIYFVPTKPAKDVITSVLETSKITLTAGNLPSSPTVTKIQENATTNDINQIVDNSELSDVPHSGDGNAERKEENDSDKEGVIYDSIEKLKKEVGEHYGGY